jgi:hypothetical protein
MRRAVLKGLGSLCAVTLISCSRGDVISPEVLTVNVSADASTCSVKGRDVPCSDLPNHLKTLKVPSTTLVALSDAMIGRTDDALTNLAHSVRAVHYGEVTVVGLISEPN